MKWDETGIAIWNFYRISIPDDITNETPNPDNWGVPSAALAAEGCDPFTYFVNHSIVFGEQQLCRFGEKLMPICLCRYYFLRYV